MSQEDPYSRIARVRKTKGGKYLAFSNTGEYLLELAPEGFDDLLRTGNFVIEEEVGMSIVADPEKSWTRSPSRPAGFQAALDPPDDLLLKVPQSILVHPKTLAVLAVLAQHVENVRPLEDRQGLSLNGMPILSSPIVPEGKVFFVGMPLDTGKPRITLAQDN